MSSQDFPGPSWPDRSRPDDEFPGYRPANGSRSAYGQGEGAYDANGQPLDGPANGAGPTGAGPTGAGPTGGGAHRGRRSEPRHSSPRASGSERSEPRYSEPRYSDPLAGGTRRGGSGGGVNGGANGIGGGGGNGRGWYETAPVDGGNSTGTSAGRSNGYGDGGPVRGRGDRGYSPRSGRTPRSDGNGQAGNGQAGNGYPANGYSDRGRGPADYSGNGYPGNGYSAGGYSGNGYAGGDYQGSGSAAGRPGVRRGASDEYGSPALDDSAAWFRPAGGYDSTGIGTTGRRSTRPGYYTPEEDTGFNEKIRARTPYAPAEPDARPGGPGRRAGAPGGDGPSGPDDEPTSPIKRFLLRIWRGKWWRHWSFKKVGLLTGALAALLVLVLIASFFVVLKATRVPLVALSQPLHQSSLVYFSDGKVVGCFCTADRTVLTEDQIKHSKNLVAAVLAAEDRSFFTEGGVSLTGILRAAKDDLSGNSLQGGSTITEQFVKTYYDPTGLGNLTMKQKIKEIFVAIKLAKREPKWWILWHYLNAIPLGAGANGVQAAAETYFGRKATQLTVSQAAMIAAMIQAPYGYEPTDPTEIPTGLPNSLVDRWVYVLTNMVRDGAITQQQMNAIVPDPTDESAAVKDFPKVRIRLPDSSWKGYRGYIMQLVANELQTYYGYSGAKGTTTALGNDGLQIHTTINQKLMQELYSAVKQNKELMAEMGEPMPSYVNISAVLEKPGTGQILAFYGGPGYGAKHCSWYHCNVNSILQAEPVGSSFKPYVLATAVSQGMDVQDSVLNTHSPLCIPPDWTYTYQHMLSKVTTNCPDGYWPFNESSENYAQNLSVPYATAVSNDPAYEDLIHRTTVQSVINMAQNLGVSPIDVAGLNDLFGNHCLKHFPNCHPGAVNAALGEGSLTAVDQANTFSTLVSGGISVTPHVIKYVVGANGVRMNAHVVKRQALQPEVAGDTDYALSFDTQVLPDGLGAGTGVPNAVWNRPMIAKTGTLGSGAFSAQAWFVGAIPQYSMSVGMFVTKPNAKTPEILDVLPTLGGWQGGYGGAWPAHIWHTFMSETFNNLQVEQLPAQGYTGDNPLFAKWVQALPVKKKKPKCATQPGQGQHHFHHFVTLGNGSQCSTKPNPGPSNSPSPSPTPSSPSPTPSSPSPTPSLPTPTPSQTVGPPFGAEARLPKSPRHAADTGLVVSLATLPNELPSKPGWLVNTTLA
ncbi:MAG TPA: transglycosylase domain-containing protein [Streptosporangiaceae bacterium]|nr:transglycosylase domain-containing protein [Streptosporangiaceae bacterium]